MGISDADSIVHLLRSISPWGMLFLILFILPLYLGLWTGILKLLGFEATGSKQAIGAIFLLFALSLLLLKIGVEKDKEKKLLGERVKNFMISYGFKGIEFNRLIGSALPESDTEELEELIERFPEDFTLTYFHRKDTVADKGILLTNVVNLRKIDTLHENLLPVAYTVVKNYLPTDSMASGDQIYQLDDRFNYEMVELLGVRYPTEFTLVSRNEQNKFLLKKIK